MDRRKIRLIIACALVGLLLILCGWLAVMGIRGGAGVQQSIVTVLGNVASALTGGLVGGVIGFYFGDADGRSSD